MDPTEACLELLTLNQDSSFKEPKHVTTIIAKFEHCMHLTCLREIRACAAQYSGIHGEPTACDQLQLWFTEKTYLMFTQLHSLQHKASAIAYDTMGLPNVWWTDTKTWQCYGRGGPYFVFPIFPCGLYTPLSFLVQ